MKSPADEWTRARGPYTITNSSTCYRSRRKEPGSSPVQ